MPSTYTSSLKLELIANGEQETTWGQTTNNNMGTLIEQAITGVQPITLTGDVELTNYNGISDQSRNAVLVFNGALANSANVVVPPVTKTYILSNRAGANVTVKTASGTGVTLANGVNTYVYCDGTNFITAVDTSNIRGDLTVSGNQTVGGEMTVGGNITLKTKVTSNTGTLSLTGSTDIVDMSTNTGAFTPPYGATADRPGTPALGMTRWNSTLGILEIWNGVQWQNITGNYAVDYLIVAGGGGGGGGGGGAAGGGAGGLVANSTTVTVGTAYTITVGSGGTAGTEFVNAGGGANSSAFSLTAVGGGYGGGYYLTQSGGSGGSGGGANNLTPGSGVSGQGYAGGTGYNANNNGGGGGGFASVGANATSVSGGAGGTGNTSTITGSSVTYAAGGTGATNNVGPSNNGTANTGNGGGAGSSGGAGGAGGTGVVIIRYASASQRGTGGTVTSYSDAGITYFVHTFTTSGTYTA